MSSNERCFNDIENEFQKAVFRIFKSPKYCGLHNYFIQLLISDSFTEQEEQNIMKVLKQREIARQNIEFKLYIQKGNYSERVTLKEAIKFSKLHKLD